MNITDEAEFVRTLQNVIDLADYFKNNSLPTDREVASRLERQSLKLLELCSEEGTPPSVACNFGEMKT